MPGPRLGTEVDGPRCGKEGCKRKLFEKGLCRLHLREQETAGDAPAAETKTPPKTAAEAKLNQTQVEAAVVTLMQLLSSTVDESFNALEKVALNDGTVTYRPTQRVESAVKDMMPWLDIYGGTFLQYLPWFGLISGVATLVAPSINPITEIIAGVRKPVMSRTPVTDAQGHVIDPDIYTEAWKQALERQRQKAEADKARNQTITVAPEAKQ